MTIKVANKGLEKTCKIHRLGLASFPNRTRLASPQCTVHSGAARGHRTFWAMVEIIEAVLESLRPLLSDLRTVVLLNFKEV